MSLWTPFITDLNAVLHGVLHDPVQRRREVQPYLTAFLLTQVAHATPRPTPPCRT